jgi:hypothetical protein
MMFAILFNSLLQDQLGICNQISNPTQDFTLISKTNCSSVFANGTKVWGARAQWISYDINYDNIYQSMISLFILSTLEGWPE